MNNKEPLQCINCNYDLDIENSFYDNFCNRCFTTQDFDREDFELKKLEVDKWLD